MQLDGDSKPSWWELLAPLLKSFVTALLSKKSTPAEAVVAGGFLLIVLGIFFAGAALIPFVIETSVSKAC